MTPLCAICGKILEPSLVKRAAKYCGKECYRAYLKRNYVKQTRTSKTGLPSNLTGDVSEWIVVLDLIRRGYHVFKPLTSNAPCDLIITKGASIIRVEVRTSHLAKAGFPSIPLKDADVWSHELMAAVIQDDDSIFYSQII